jgi:hypothetical protein
MLEMFSSQIVQHIPIGIVKQDNSQLADRLEMALQSSPVLDVKLLCHDMSECEHAVIRGDLQTFIVFPNELERRALRLEAPVIPVYSSGQNYLTNMFATKEFVRFLPMWVQNFSPLRLKILIKNRNPFSR